MTGSVTSLGNRSINDNAAAGSVLAKVPTTPLRALLRFGPAGRAAMESKAAFWSMFGHWL